MYLLLFKSNLMRLVGTEPIKEHTCSDSTNLFRIALRGISSLSEACDTPDISVSGSLSRWFKH
jgi:hypothetical protein